MKGAEKNGGYCNIHKGINFNNSAERLLAWLHASPFEEAAAIPLPSRLATNGRAKNSNSDPLGGK